MDAKLLYWTGALLNFALVAGFLVSGVRHVRRGEIARHRRSMTIAGLLVLGFIASYGVKLAVLGRENLAVWSATSVHTLRFHETCVLLMLVCGGFAIRRGLGLRGTRLVTRDSGDPLPDPRLVRSHRIAGRIAVTAALLGLVSAVFVLAGMIGRL